FHIYTGLLTGLLDNRLGLLTRAVDRGLVQELQPLAILLADAVSACLPSGLLQELGGLFDAELPRRVLGDELHGSIEVVGAGASGAPVDVFLNGIAVDQQRKRLAYRRIGEQRMLGLDRGALAVDLDSGIGKVQRDEFDIAAR